MRATRTTLLLMAAALLPLVLASCDDDEINVGGPGTGAQPLVSAVTASHEIVDQGGTVTVAVDAAGGGLVYLWTATGGSFADPAARTTVWTAPEAPGVYLLTVAVRSSDNLTATASVAVGVEVALELTAAADTVTVAHTTTIAALAVGEDLVYYWTADTGTLAQVTPNTVTWKAPDTAPLGGARVQVLVSTADGDTRSESIALTVLPYAPVDAPAYRGAAYCGGCHLDIYESWLGTAHAHAVQTLADIGMDGNGYCLACHTVGSNGLGADPALDNGGHDDVPLAALEGVQCENCHGPGSQHPSGGMARLAVSRDASVCGACHNGPHHPTYEEWQTSGHGRAEENTYPAGRTSCVKCHNGAFAGEYLDDPAGFEDPESVDTIESHTCAVCHDLHGNDNPAHLRDAAVTDVVLPDGSVIPEAGAGRLCMACHNGRRAPEDIDEMLTEGSSHFGPHHSNQGDMLAGTGAYEDVAPGFAFGSSRHLQIEDGCVHCHTLAQEGSPAYTGHTFQPTLNACKQCHGTLTSFEEVAASEDFDGDGLIEGVQLEVTGLMEILRQTIIDASDTPQHRNAFVADFEGAVGDITISTLAQREAAYNYFFVEFDHSRGVHNARYAVQLLQQSILHLQPAGLKGAVVLRD